MNKLKKIINLNDIIRFIISFSIIFLILTFFLKPIVKYENFIRVENKVDQTFMTFIRLHNADCFNNTDYVSVIHNLRDEKSYEYLSNLSNNISIEIIKNTLNENSIYVIEFDEDTNSEIILETLNFVNLELSSIISNLILKKIKYCMLQEDKYHEQNKLEIFNVFINYLNVLAVDSRDEIEIDDLNLMFNNMINSFNLTIDRKNNFDSQLIKDIQNNKFSNFLYSEFKKETKKININRYAFIILTSLVISLLFSGIYNLIKINYKRSE